MNVKNYVSLKSKSAVSLSKETLNGENHYFLTQKRWDGETGTALADNKLEVELNHYESDKSHIENEIAELTTKKDALTEIIKDIKAL
tara:strand:+ start:219 stop:479 length:261 start_codon:yes stop_codon:yes gene_type:complete